MDRVVFLRRVDGCYLHKKKKTTDLAAHLSEHRAIMKLKNSYKINYDHTRRIVLFAIYKMLFVFQILFFLLNKMISTKLME